MATRAGGKDDGSLDKLPQITYATHYLAGFGHTLKLVFDFLVPGLGPKAPGRNSAHFGGSSASGAQL